MLACAQLLNGATQRDPIRYCIDWNLLPRQKKYVRFTAKGPKSPGFVTLREWTPPNAEVDKFWNEPLRAIFTFWWAPCPAAVTRLVEPVPMSSAVHDSQTLA